MKLNAFTVMFAFFFFGQISGQNELKKWYFGTFAGLDFMTSPPTIITSSGMMTSEGCSSISDAAGNILLYTNGKTVYNKNNVPMANGTGLSADESSTQTGLIVRQPGSQTIYYVFSLDGTGANGGLNYSIVDMSLAAGLGSVTVQNVPLCTPSTEKLAATSHCNGTDVWVVSHDYNSMKTARLGRGFKICSIKTIVSMYLKK